MQNLRKGYMRFTRSDLHYILFGILSLVGLSGCDTSNNVVFKGDRANKSQPTVTAPGFSSSQGGIYQSQTISGYKVDLSFGGPVSLAGRRTANGYLVELNGLAHSSR